ncbi:MAG: hypothetical protein ACXWDO_05655 [Bacteroidia bacterium]
MDQYRMIESKDVSGFLLAFLSFFKQLLLYIYASVKKYLVIAVIIFSLITGAAFYYWKIQKPQYETEMVCAFNNLSKKVYGEMLLKLGVLLKSNSYPALAQTLQLPVKDVASITSIQAKNIAGSPLHEDITADQTPIYISVKATDKKILKPLQYAIVNYLNNSSPYRQRRNKMEMEIIGSKMKFLNRDMRQADSIISAYTGFLRKTSSVTDSAAGFSNIAEMMSYKNELEDKQVQHEWRIMELQNSVEVLHGFIVPDYPSKQNNILGMAIPLAFILSVLIPVLLNLLLTEPTSATKKENNDEPLETQTIAAGL